MTLPALLTSFGRDTMLWLTITLILGGAAALAAGRALAQAWRGRGRAIFYSAILAGAACFLSYALFHVSAIPMQAIASATMVQDYHKLASLLSVWAVTFVILSLFSVVAWCAARNRMMAGQYGFLNRPPAPPEAPSVTDLQA